MLRSRVLDENLIVGVHLFWYSGVLNCSADEKVEVGVLKLGVRHAERAALNGDAGFFSRQQGLLYRNAKTLTSPNFASFRSEIDIIPFDVL